MAVRRARGAAEVLAELLETLRGEIAAHPAWPDLRHKAAVLLAESGDIDGAREQARAAVERNSKYSDALVTLAFIELSAGSRDIGPDARTQAMEARPPAIDAPAPAAEAIERAQALRPEDWRTHAAAGLFWMCAGHLPRASAAMEGAVQRAPDRPLPWFARAHALERARHPGAALARAEAERRFPTFASRGRNLSIVGNPARALIRREAAFHLAQLGDTAGASDWLGMALSIDLDESADAAARGELEFAAGEVREAAASFRRAIELDPELVKPRVSLAYALGVEGDLDGAIAELEAAIKRKPKYADLRYQLATLLLDRGERARATSQLEAALGVNPHYAAAHFSLGLARLSEGRYADAAARFESSRKGGFAAEDSAAYLGFCLLELGDRKAAGRAFSESIEADGSHALPHLGRALIADQEGQKDEARRALARYRDLDGPIDATGASGESERLLAVKAGELLKRLASGRVRP